MTEDERFISLTDDEYVYFLDSQSEDYKTLEDFEKQEFEDAKRDNIDIEEYEDAILQSASDKYWDYVYEYHVEADVVCDRLNEQEERIKELEEENKVLKNTIKMYSNATRNDIDYIKELEEENEKLKKENKFLRCTIESNSQDDYIDYLEKQNERLKERITELASNDKIVFMNGQDYEIF